MSESSVTISLQAVVEAHGRIVDPSDGSWMTDECRLCAQELDDGDPIIRHATRGWVHLLCLAEEVRSMEPDQAWLTLAEQIARSPSRYRAGEIRAVMQNLIVLARRGLPASWSP